MLELKSLIKEHPPTFILGPIDFDFDQSTTLALLGRNGAGKSTLFQLITGNIDATSGQIFIDKHELSTQEYYLKRRLGYLPQELGLPLWNSPLELLKYGVHLYKIRKGKEKVEQLLKEWDIDYFKNKALATCSYGMQKRVGLALATMHEPDLLILDEPHSGLDLEHCQHLDSYLNERKKSRLFTIMSTHTLTYAAKLCDRAIILKKGQITCDISLQGQTWYAATELLEKKFFEN